MFHLKNKHKVSILNIITLILLLLLQHKIDKSFKPEMKLML